MRQVGKTVFGAYMAKCQETGLRTRKSRNKEMRESSADFLDVSRLRLGSLQTHFLTVCKKRREATQNGK